MQDDKTIVNQTRCWLKSVIIGLNFCPFAGREFENNSIHYQVSHAADAELALYHVMDECERLDDNPAIETTLLIFARAFQDFADYLDFLEMANSLLVEQGYEGVYQLASFHPGYCFEGETPDDAANYTNRSPYPMLHFIREASLEKVLLRYPEPELIPQRNIKLARSKGQVAMQTMLEHCLHDGDS